MPVEKWFSIPIYFSYIENIDLINKELLDVYKSQQFSKREFWGTKTHSVSDPNFSSNFITQYNCNNFTNEIIKHVYAYMAELNSKCTKPFKIQSSWFTKTEPGEYTRSHNHGYADISGAYYIQTNGNDGNLTFISPTPTLSSTVFASLGDTVSYKPDIGKIILFPGWLYHSVNENDTDTTRISVSFNIFFEK
jgi:uncharacterized protein (TIGR02466 family)